MSILPPTKVGFIPENEKKTEEYFYESLCGNSWDDQDWWECYLILKTMITSIVGHDFDIGVNICIQQNLSLPERSKALCNYAISRLSKYLYMHDLKCDTILDAVCTFKRFIDITFPRVSGRNRFALTRKVKVEDSARGPYGKCDWIYTYSWCGVEKFISKHQIPFTALSPKMQVFYSTLS